MTAWTETIDALIGYLRYRQELGERSVEMDPSLLALLAAGTTASATVPVAGQPVAGTSPTVALPPAQAPIVPASARPPVDDRPIQLATTRGDDPDARQSGLDGIVASIAACQRCALCQTRQRTVPGQGRRCSPEIMFVGEAPGADEDAQGLAFVGAAGQLLTKMIVAMGLTREEVFIGNICKCRPPHNRQPTLDEMRACLPFLRAQLAIIRPRVIVALGAVAVKGLLDTQVGITRLRGHWTSYGDTPLMPTFHPAYLLRYPAAKRDSWNDLKSVLNRIGRPVPNPNSQGARESDSPHRVTMGADREMTTP